MSRGYAYLQVFGMVRAVLAEDHEALDAVAEHAMLEHGPRTVIDVAAGILGAIFQTHARRNRMPVSALVDTLFTPDDSALALPAVVRTAWKPNEIELVHLARGGTVWLSTWGGLPPVSLEVQAPS